MSSANQNPGPLQQAYHDLLDTLQGQPVNTGTAIALPHNSLISHQHAAGPIQAGSILGTLAQPYAATTVDVEATRAKRIERFKTAPANIRETVINTRKAFQFSYDAAKDEVSIPDPNPRAQSFYSSLSASYPMQIERFLPFYMFEIEELEKWHAEQLTEEILLDKV